MHYAFDRPNNGEKLTGDLRTFIPSPWVGSVRSGARMQLPGNALVGASVGYLSFAQNGLDVWEGKLRLSVGFLGEPYASPNQARMSCLSIP